MSAAAKFPKDRKAGGDRRDAGGPTSSPADPGFRLPAAVLPEPPATGDWLDALRWMVMAMPADDEDMDFIASLLSHRARTGALSDRQAKYAGRCYDRLIADYQSRRAA